MLSSHGISSSDDEVPEFISSAMMDSRVLVNFENSKLRPVRATVILVRIQVVSSSE